MKDDVHILLDMDGVLCEFAQAAAALHGYPKMEITDWNMEEAFGITQEEFWDNIHAAGEGFWSSLKPTPWLADLLLLIEDYEYTIASCPSRAPQSYSGKRQWLINHLGVNTTNVMFGKQKWLMAGPNRILIDDNEKNCRKFAEMGGHSILFPRSWNHLREFDAQDRHIEYVENELGKCLRKIRAGNELRYEATTLGNNPR